ncbi:hypothetical protein BJ546DRAFT_1048155 [Cryomyces antarcticus]
MASEAAVSGSGSTDLSPAQQLMERHAAEEAHRATVEDAVDEEDIAHPPPSGTASAAEPNDESTPTPPSTLSEKAAGKQKAQDSPRANTPLNTVGGGVPVSRDPQVSKPASVGKGTNGITNGEAQASSNVPSRASTPASGMLTPSSTLPSQADSQRGPALPSMSIPGRYAERVQFAPSQLTPRNQLKKPVKDVLNEINKRSKAKVEMKTGPQGMIIFEGQGPVEAVRQALKEVANQLGSNQSVKVAVPASVRAHVIGRQGATIQAISKRTGARIQVPKQEDSTAMDEDDDSSTIDVVIEGDAVTAEMARREIEAIVNERTSTVNMRLKDVPAEYFPFLAGAHNSRINAIQEGRDVRVQIPQYHTWSSQAPPQAPPNRQPAAFAPQAGSSIQISGDRQAAAEARAEIERQVQELQRQLTAEQMSIERGRHQFIVGDKGNAMHDFLEKTGCAVILPPDSEDSEMLTIVGPADRLEDAMNEVMELASSMQMSSVDIAKQHPKAPQGAQAHARNVTRYLQQRQAIEELERLHDARIIVPTSIDSPSAWEIYSREAKNAMRARTDIMNLISGHPPTRLSPVDVDPFYHQHLQQQAAQQIRNDYGVHLVIPDDTEDSPQLLLVYEGLTAASEYELPRRQPSAAEVRDFGKALSDAQAHILGLISGQQDVVSRDIDAPSKFHDKIQRYVDSQQQSLPAGKFPVQLMMGGRPQQRQAAPSNGVSMRGPSNAVDDLVERVMAFIEQEKQDEVERGFVTSFDFPQKYANVLIGKRGENIKKLRDEFDVDIQVNDGKIELKGPQAKANACKAHIMALAKKLEDEATYTLKIKPQYHRELIGAKGSQVNRLQERYNVRINFPRSAPTPDEDQPASDATAGAQRGHSNQAPDEVVIRGPKRGADEAREELLNLLQWTIDNSHVASVSVAPDQIPSLIGAGGREMENMRLSTGAQIDVPSRDAIASSDRAEIKIRGTKKQVEDAKKLLQERAKVFDDTITRTLDVDKKHHRTIIGGGGSNIRDIVMKAGGPDDRRELARMVRFPRADSDESQIRVEGNKDVVDKIIASIEAIASQLANQTTEHIEVAPEKHRLLIGRGGETRRNLESQFNVGIDVPKQTTTGAARSQVKLSGQPADVEKAKAHILTLVKDQEGETVLVPRHVHHAIADNGQFFRRLRNDHKVTVDHAGQQPPPKPAASQPRRGNNKGGSLPLITDDAATSAANFSWELHDASASAAESGDGDIPWILRGPNAESVAKAKSALERALQDAEKHTHTGFLILPDPRAYRLVVGPGGSQINAIRKQTGSKVSVPRDQARGEAIEIAGSREGCEEAKEIILNLVKGQEQ